MKRPLDPEKYEMDSEDGLVREIVGPWARDKHERLTRYIDISKNVRQKFLVGPAKEATFIDLYSGSGRARIRDSNDVIDGSCVAGWKAAVAGGKLFTKVIIADRDEEILSAAEMRLRAAGAPVQSHPGSAENIVDKIRASLSPHGLHFAFLDPYNLNDLPFSVLQTFAKCKRIDLLIHISLGDLQRNLTKYLAQTTSPLDRFAPGWRQKVTGIGDQGQMRGKIFEHWKALLLSLNLHTTEAIELVRGPENQRLYWLALVAHDEKALEFWKKISAIGPKQLSIFD
jgi:three-Cys-motif partner protein